MSCTVEPKTLGFHRPLTTLIKSKLSIHNPNLQPIIFKVKTTAPKQYVVRPNCGRVEPGETGEVVVFLQPMKEDPPFGAVCKDKFLIQSAFIPSSALDSSPLPDLWHNIEQTSKSSISDQKIRVSYLPPVGSSIAEGPGEVTADGIDATFASTGMSSFANNDFGESVFTNARDGDQTRSVIAPNGSSMSTEQHVTGHEEKSPSYSSEFVENLKAKYEEEIERLKSELNQGLRKRNLPDTTEMNEKVGGKIQVIEKKTGVPVEVVAGLVVGVFLVTWLFF